jgi:hypothetical protein
LRIEALSIIKQLKNEIKSAQSDTLKAYFKFCSGEKSQPGIFASTRLSGLIRRTTRILHKFKIASAPLGHEGFHLFFL